LKPAKPNIFKAMAKKMNISIAVNKDCVFVRHNTIVVVQIWKFPFNHFFSDGGKIVAEEAAELLKEFFESKIESKNINP